MIPCFGFVAVVEAVTYPHRPSVASGHFAWVRILNLGHAPCQPFAPVAVEDGLHLFEVLAAVGV